MIRASSTELALVAFAQGKPGDARPFVDQDPVCEHPITTSRARSQKRLDTAVAKTDPAAAPKARSGMVDHDRIRRAPHNTGGGGGRHRRWRLRHASSRKPASWRSSNCPSRDGRSTARRSSRSLTGVEALTGIGYCWSRRASSSRARSRSSAPRSRSGRHRFEPALAGIAETYQQQGNKEQAIAAWQRVPRHVPRRCEGEEAARDPRRRRADRHDQRATAPPTPTPTPAPTPPTPDEQRQRGNRLRLRLNR